MSREIAARVVGIARHPGIRARRLGNVAKGVVDVARRQIARIPNAGEIIERVVAESRRATTDGCRLFDAIELIELTRRTPRHRRTDRRLIPVVVVHKDVVTAGVPAASSCCTSRLSELKTWVRVLESVFPGS